MADPEATYILLQPLTPRGVTGAERRPDGSLIVLWGEVRHAVRFRKHEAARIADEIGMRTGRYVACALVSA